jgi:GTP-binding protein EngB required for normal cell division
MMSGGLLGITAKCRQFQEFLLENDLGKELDLPQIAALGDTSSGKSSVLSAMSSVVFPSRHDITTRCPTRLRMDTGESFRCKLQIIWHKQDSSNQRISESVDTPLAITAAIDKLQTLILEHEKTGSGVSKSIIEIRLTGPEYPNLTLIDLPGIVRSTSEHESRDMIDDIRHVMDQYLKNPRCILLALQPAHIDRHNNEVFQLTKDVDPQSLRTIPVITKIDLVEPGTEASVMKLIKGEDAKFSLGFSVVKCRTQEQLDKKMSLQKSFEEERLFFENRKPWNQLKQKDMCGIPNLIRKLSFLYLEMIQSTMPSVLSELSTKKKELQQELLEFDADLSTCKLRREFVASVEMDVKTRLRTFAIEQVFDKSMSDGWTYRALVEKTKKDFANKVFSSPLSEEITPEHFNKNDSVSVFINGKEIQARIAQVTTSKDGLQSSATYCLLPKNALDDDSFLEKTIDTSWTCDGTFSKYQIVTWSNNTPIDVGVIYEDDKSAKKTWKTRKFSTAYTSADLATDTVSAVASMRARIERLRGPDLPVFLNASIFNSIVSAHLESKWVPLSMEFAASIRELVLKFIKQHVLEAIKARTKQLPKVLVCIEGTLMEHVDALFKSSVASIEVACDFERIPSTFNHYFSENITKQRFDKQRRQLKSMTDASGNIPYATLELVLNQNSRKSIDDFVAEEMLIVLDAYGACRPFYQMSIL